MNVNHPGQNSGPHEAVVAASSSPPTAVGRVGSFRKRVIDETLLSTEEAEKLQSRRAYNRECAARARKRSKNMVAQLQDEIQLLQSEKQALQRERGTMSAGLETLEQQNRILMAQATAMVRHQQLVQQSRLGTLRQSGLCNAVTAPFSAMLGSNLPSGHATAYPSPTNFQR
jgi:hypothetical protein